MRKEKVKKIAENWNTNKNTFAKLTVLSISLYSHMRKNCDKANQWERDNKPANTGFLKDNQLAKDNIIAKK